MYPELKIQDYPQNFLYEILYRYRTKSQIIKDTAN